MWTVEQCLPDLAAIAPVSVSSYIIVTGCPAKKGDLFFVICIWGPFSGLNGSIKKFIKKFSKKVL